MSSESGQPHRAGSDWPFLITLGVLGGSYVLLIAALIVADLAFTSPRHFVAALTKPEIQYAIWLTLLSCTISAILSVWVATPLGYLLSRFTFRGRWLIDTIIDIPVVLPPLEIYLNDPADTPPEALLTDIGLSVVEIG